ncbi:MAG: CbiX/SirB N-terminal domain-containing protein [Candidatus Omnitrophota bacterium]|nr:CbiX/SirB N-terminal domain-containing protein [Candidatus Omnitrophota bacterium]
MKAVLLASHGSYSPKTKQEIITLARRLKRRSGRGIVRYAFLEIESPNIPHGIDLCVQDGATEIIVLLNFLNSGKHADQDIPKIIRNATLRHPGIKIRMTKPLAHHPQFVKFLATMIRPS